MTTSHVRRPRNGDPTAILPIEKSTGPGPESLLLGALAASREAAKPRRTRVHPVRSRGVMQPFMRVMYTTRPRPWSLGVRTGALYDGDLSSGQPGLRRFGSYLPGSKDVHVVELESKRKGGNGVRSVRLTFEREACPRRCGSRAPPLRHGLQVSLLSHRPNQRVDNRSSSRRDATVRTCLFAPLSGSTTICQMDRSDPIAMPSIAIQHSCDNPAEVSAPGQYASSNTALSPPSGGASVPTSRVLPLRTRTRTQPAGRYSYSPRTPPLPRPNSSIGPSTSRSTSTPSTHAAPKFVPTSR
jgi:hypothetical protein